MIYNQYRIHLFNISLFNVKTIKMKGKIYLIVILFFTMLTTVLAQVSEEEKAMSQGENNAIVVNIPTTTTKITEKVWKSFSKKFNGKTKRNRKTEELVTTGASNANLNMEGDLTLFTQILSNNEDVELALWIKAGDDFLASDSNPEGYKEIERMLKEFALEVRIETVNEELKAEEKILFRLDKDLKKLKRDKEGYQKDIKNSEKRIEDSERGLVRNEEDQKNAKDNLRLVEDYFTIQRDSLEDLMTGVTDKDEKKRLKREIKNEQRKVRDAKGVQTKAEREEKKMRKTIENANKTIKDSEAKIVQNEVDQQNKLEEIATQEQVIAEVKGRLNRLKDLR